MAKKKSKVKLVKKTEPAKKEGFLSRIKLPSFGLIKKPALEAEDVKSIEDEVRETINWVAVFEKEYDLPKEAVDELLEKLHSIARKVGWLKCK